MSRTVRIQSLPPQQAILLLALRGAGLHEFCFESERHLRFDGELGYDWQTGRMPEWQRRVFQILYVDGYRRVRFGRTAESGLVATLLDMADPVRGSQCAAVDLSSALRGIAEATDLAARTLAGEPEPPKVEQAPSLEVSESTRKGVENLLDRVTGDPDWNTSQGDGEPPCND